KRVRKRRPEVVVGPCPERPAATDEVFPHAALRLVQRGRGAACERCAVELGRDLALVDAVAELVHGGEDAAQVVLLEARRQADVADRETRRERVLAAVEPPRALVEPEPLEERADERLLALDRKRALERLDRAGVA